MEDMFAFECGPDGRSFFVIFILADGTHFMVRYFINFTCIAALFASFNEFFIAMVAEI
jgi:hypothetical protein